MARASTFTSYINVEPAKGVEAAFAQLEQRSKSTFGKIAAEAARANQRATAGLISGRGNAIGGPSTQAIRLQAATMRQVAVENRNAAQAAGQFTARLGAQTVAAARTRKEVTGLERALRTTATTMNVVQGPLGPVAGRVSAMAAAVSQLSGARLGLAGAGAVMAGFVSQANQYQQMRSQLMPLYESQEDVNRAMRETVAIAKESRTALAPVVDLYARLTMAGRDVGLSQRQTSEMTRIASMAAKLSGGAIESQQAGLYQFSQGIGSGNLGGDELRSVREGTLRLAKAIADGLGVPIAKLKELGKEGRLTPQVIAQALANSSAQIEAEFARLPATISSSAAELRNAFMVMVGEGDQTLGVTTALAEAMSAIAQNIGMVTTALAFLGSAYAGSRLQNYTAGLIEQARAWNTTRIETKKAATEALNTATAQRQAAGQRVAQLRKERAEIRATVNADREARRQAIANARAQLAESKRQGMGFENPRASAAYTQAMNQARVANTNYAASMARLTAIQDRLQASQGGLVSSTNRLRLAKIMAARASQSFGKAMLGAIAAINPLGIAIGIAVQALIMLAFRQDAAGRAADALAERQNNLARFIDMTTGKIIQQNQALLAGERLKARQTLTDATEAYQTSRSNVQNGEWWQPRRMWYPGQVQSRGDASAQAQVQRYRDRQITAPQLAAWAEQRRAAYQTALANPNATRAQRAEFSRQSRVMDDVIRTASAATSAATTVVQAAATVRLLEGRGRPGDVQLAGGTVDPTGRDIPAAAAGGGSGGGGGGGRARSAEAAARREQAARERAEREAERAKEQADRRTENRTGIMDRYDVEPRAIDRAAKDARELQRLVGETLNGITAISEANPLGSGIYTQEMADADKARINTGLRRPIEELLQQQRQSADIADMRADGYELEANALEKALELQRAIGTLSQADYERILEGERAQQRINDALESRGRLTSAIMGAVQNTRDAFEDMLVNLPSQGFGSIKNFAKSIMQDIMRIQAKRLTERLFGGADAKVRELLQGQEGVGRAIKILEENTTDAADSTNYLASAVENAAQRINEAAESIATGVPSATGAAAAVDGGFGSMASGVASVARTLAAGAGAIGISIGGTPISGVDENGDIVVNSPRRDRRTPSGRETYNTIFEGFGGALDKIFGTDTFFSKIGKGVGTAFQGAGTGMMASGFAKALGIKQSSTGAAIGGALGALTMIPGMDIVGGLLGGTIGGLFKKTKKASATIGAGQYGGLAVTSTTGNSGSYRDNANTLAGSVIDQLDSVANALGGGLGGAISVSIGQRKKKFVVDTSGRGKTKGGGTVKFDSEEEAIQYAIMDAIKDGVITGISQASQNILKSGQDLQKALNKALVIESIPKRLMQRTDPVRYAITELNREFETMINILKEAGATSEQFADAAKLYELERADAISSATSQAVEAIQQYLDEMKGGSSSPYNKKTVYDNATDQLAKYRDDIMAGKIVDQSDLLTAARNWQDASRSLNGSSGSFFKDFDDLYALLEKAKGNAMGTGNTDLPGSPFSNDAQVQSILGQLNNVTLDQTKAVTERLDRLIYIAGSGGFVGGAADIIYGHGNAINLLPGATK